MGLNWKALAPHRPLDSGEPGYVPPPSDFAERAARSIAAGVTTILVAGPVGVGKSTELARAAALLHGDRVACLVQVDRYENIRRLTPDQLLLRIAGRLFAFATESLGLHMSGDLPEALVEAGVLPREFSSRWVHQVSPFQGSAVSLARATLAQVSRFSPLGRVALIVDGLEKLPEGAGAAEVLASFGQLGDDVDLILAVPWFAAFNNAEDIVRPGARLLPLPAPEVDGDRGEPGRQFLLDILARRLGLPSESFDPAAIRSAVHGDINHAREVARARRELVFAAARQSGGLPRTFLQLMADSAQYAQLRRGDDWPNEQDLADAVADQRDSFRRVLLPGDTEAIRRCDGTDGREMELGRKVRLLARGVILERQRDHEWMMDVHPLVRPLLGGSSGA